MNKPVVSIVIPAYNSAGVLGRAIDSVINQTFADWELVVVDDGSTDDTWAVLDSYRESLGSRLVAVRQQNSGASVARNAGIEKSKGKFIAFLDADDAFVPTKLARQVEFFEKYPDYGLVYSDYAYVDLNGQYHESAFRDSNPIAANMPGQEISPGLICCGNELFDRMCGRYIISTITGMVRRSVLGNNIRFIPGHVYSEEWLFFLEVARNCRGGFVNESLSVHYYTAGSVSRSDVIRNNLQQVKAVEYILKRYPDMSRESRKSLSRQILQCYRQLGLDFLRSGEYKRSQEYFGKALKYKTDLKGMAWYAQALTRNWKS